ncbi:hypothetical protein [Pseudomonas nicosulfuronedens]
MHKMPESRRHPLAATTTFSALAMAGFKANAADLLIYEAGQEGNGLANAGAAALARAPAR